MKHFVQDTIVMNILSAFLLWRIIEVCMCAFSIIVCEKTFFCVVAGCQIHPYLSSQMIWLVHKPVSQQSANDDYLDFRLADEVILLYRITRKGDPGTKIILSLYL